MLGVLISILFIGAWSQQPQQCVIYKCGSIENVLEDKKYENLVCGLYNNRKGVFDLDECISPDTPSY